MMTCDAIELHEKNRISTFICKTHGLPPIGRLLQQKVDLDENEYKFQGNRHFLAEMQQSMQSLQTPARRSKSDCHSGDMVGLLL